MNPDHSFRLCEFFLTWLAEDRFHVLQELTFTEATQVRPAGCWLIAANHAVHRMLAATTIALRAAAGRRVSVLTWRFRRY